MRAKGGDLVVQRGEIWWGSPALPGGSRKHRPFLIVSQDGFNRNERYPKVMVVHLTTVRRVGGSYPWEVDLPRGSGGLATASVAKCGQIYTLLKSHLGELSGSLSSEQMGSIDRALAVVLSLPPGCPGSRYQ
jgi:mRNA-degrading endonuclease toxin of MazEF toxin-antitoxin module